MTGERFLIVRLGSLGDVVHAVPAAAALRQRYPQSQIDWLVEPRYVDLLSLVECVDRRIPVDLRQLSQGRFGLFSTLGELRRAHYDAVIDLQGLLKSAILARLVSARRTIGFPQGHLREPLARVFYTDAPDPGTATHVIHKNLALMRALGADSTRVLFPISIPRTAAVDQIADRFGSAGYVLINPGAAWPNKRWPPERFGAVAAQIQRDLGFRSVVLWGPGEQPLASAVAAASSGTAEAAPPTTVPDVVGIARSARLMISGDTGPLHLAGAVGTPIVALFGPTYPERNGPWGSRDITVSRVSQCVCLYERRCRRAEACINDITVDEVTTAVRQRLSVHA